MWNKLMGVPLALLALTVLCESDRGWAFPWDRDMAEQPAIQPYSQLMPLPPAGTLAQSGEWPVSRFERALLPANPVAGDEKATERGKKLYGIYCTPCHGDTGHGDGPLSTKILLPADLTGRILRRRNDGYLYEVIREGTSSMPAHGAVLSQDERWAVVDYIRKLQELASDQ